MWQVRERGEVDTGCWWGNLGERKEIFREVCESQPLFSFTKTPFFFC